MVAMNKYPGLKLAFCILLIAAFAKALPEKKHPKPPCMVQGELLVIDALSEGFRNAETNGDEPSWKEIQERLREARRLILSQEQK